MNPQAKVGEPYPLQTPPLSAEERHEADCFIWEVRNAPKTADCARPREHRQHQRVIHDAVTGAEHCPAGQKWKAAIAGGEALCTSTYLVL